MMSTRHLLARVRTTATRHLEAANKELESFAYSVSHDLRAPLRAIDGFSHVLQEDYADKLDAEALRLIQVIRDGVVKMARLIDDILAFSRASRREMAASDIDMTGLVQATLNDLAPAMTGRTIKVKVAPVPRTRGDREMMQRVWINLLDNAIKFTGHKENALIEVGSYPEAENTVYFVKDNGAGFDMGYVDKLFGVFQRLHAAGGFSRHRCRARHRQAHRRPARRPRVGRGQGGRGRGVLFRTAVASTRACLIRGALWRIRAGRRRGAWASRADQRGRQWSSGVSGRGQAGRREPACGRSLCGCG